MVPDDNETAEDNKTPKDNKTPDDNKLPEEADFVPPKELNPELTELELRKGARAGDVYVRVHEPYRRFFRRIGPGHFEATQESNPPANSVESAYRAIKRILVGQPLETARETFERLDKVRALAVFGADPISSCAYATEETLLVLMAAGSGALYVSQYTALAISLLLSMVAFSYRQTVYAYPHGGGSYNVSRENLGQTAGLIAAAALLIDYVLTVSVSIVAGAAAVSSALIASGFGPQLEAINATLPHNLNANVLLSVAFIAIMTLGNLRGIRESGAIFAVPTYLFLVSLTITLIVGFYQAFTGTLYPATPPPVMTATEPLTLWLILRAFSAGAVAMSGTEAISNGVPAFQKPESKNAATTLTIMATILGVFFLGVSQLATHMSLVPGDETIISQIARAVWGTNIVYYVFQIATMGILIVAGNTAFADFPRLSSVLARDNYMPHQFLFRGDRLSFSVGIVGLGVIASLLVVVFSGDVTNLIHLYAIGVFLAFSMSDSGMVVHWWKTRGPHWKVSMLINGTDAILTSSILLIVSVTKFALGGWIVVVLIPIFVGFFKLIHHHYERVAAQLRLTPGHVPAQMIDQVVIVPIDDINYASLRAIAFARTISHEVILVHVSMNEPRAKKIKEKAAQYAPDMKFITLDTPYRAFTRPLISYIDALHKQRPDAFVTLVLPEFITAHWWEKFLHNRTATRLRESFEKHPNVAVIQIPYQLA